MSSAPTFIIATGTVSKDGPLSLRSSGKEVLLETVLSEINFPHKFILYHFPTSGLDPKKPGGGCCLYPVGECPVGHNDQRNWLFHFQAEGVPSNEGPFWKISGQELNLNVLRGHQSGVVIVPSALGSIRPQQVQLLSDQISRLKSMLDSVKSMKAGN